MNGNELRQIINGLALSQPEFARLMGVSVGAVSQWLSDTRAIPGPVIAFTSLFLRLPDTIQKTEIWQLKQGTSNMRNGMYMVHFVGSAGEGGATLTFQDGAVFGFDTEGGKYDGFYEQSRANPELVTVQVKVTMPAGVKSVVGGAVQPFDWVLPVSTDFDMRADESTVLVTTSLGPTVKAKFKRMRDLPLAA